MRLVRILVQALALWFVYFSLVSFWNFWQTIQTRRSLEARREALVTHLLLTRARLRQLQDPEGRALIARFRMGMLRPGETLWLPPSGTTFSSR